MKKGLYLFLLFMFLFAVSCGNPSSSSNASSPEIKRGVKPIADDEIAVIEMENSAAFGTIKIELYSNIAPQAVARFMELAREGFYDGVTFHRVNETVIQGGDPNSKDDDPTNDGQGGSSKPNVPAEFSDIEFVSGIVGAARVADPNSANSQFFITLRPEPNFNENYTAFGKVIEGMNNARIISGVEPKVKERPVEPVRIRTIRIEKRD
ncbi:MAG TPA: peptidylprolyl isomerase [Pyrinomonadaceae bacterium]|nr:peptidylprolyl isomerase [Pyrinomonadaceae bacterium]HMP65744.1 peptidylprolyl isomerase [Pyrinomonadaceae bacterium]